MEGMFMSDWAGYCCLMPNEQFFSYIMKRRSCIRWDDVSFQQDQDVRFQQDQDVCFQQDQDVCFQQDQDVSFQQDQDA